jgi:hypothetical protein
MLKFYILFKNQLNVFYNFILNLKIIKIFFTIIIQFAFEDKFIILIK